MNDGSTALKQYLVLLDRFGLSESEVIDLHWSGSVPDDASAGSVVAHVVDEDERTPEALFDRLHRTLAASSKGIDLPRGYDPDEPGTGLRDVLEPYNTSVELLGPDGERLTADGPVEPFDVVLTDASGATRSTTFAYPEGPLGTNNLPALLHDVETELLADTGMTFVPLEEREDRWRLLLLSEQRLSALRDTYGDDITVFDRALLHDTTLSEFAEPDPQGVDELNDGSTAPDWLSSDADAAFEDVGFETAEVEDREEDEEAVETKAIDQSGIDDLFDSMEETAGVETGGAAAADEPAVDDLVSGAASADDETPPEAETAAAADEETTADDPAADAEPATDTEPAVTPAAEPEPALSALAVTPGDAPTPAVHRIAVVPGSDPEPATRRVETEPSLTPGADPDPAVTPIAVTPAAEPEPAIERVEEPPAVVPSDDPVPAVSPIAVTPAAEPEPAVSPIAVTPAAEPETATERVAQPPAVTPGSDPTPAVEPAVAEASTERDQPAAEGTEPPADDEPADDEPADVEPAVTPTTETPTPAVRLTADAEAERLVTEDEPGAVAASGAESADDDAVATEGADAAASAETGAGDTEAPAADTEAADGPVESDAPLVTPTDGDPVAAVTPAEDTEATEESEESEGESEAETEEETESAGLLSRIAGWLGLS